MDCLIKKIEFFDSVYFIQERKPFIYDLFPVRLRNVGLHEKVRWLIQYPFGYKVFVLLTEDSKEIAYCVFSRGGNPRYLFSKQRDVIIGPYYVKESDRGKGLASLLIKGVLEKTKANTAWIFIRHDNIASIRTAEHLEFEYFCDVSYSRTMRFLAIAKPAGEMRLYKKEILNGIN